MSTRVIQRNEEENILIHNYSLLLLFAWIPTSVYKINSNELILLWRWKNTTVFLRDFLYNWINVNNINQHIEHRFRLCLFIFVYFIFDCIGPLSTNDFESTSCLRTINQVFDITWQWIFHSCVYRPVRTAKNDWKLLTNGFISVEL